MLLLATSSRLDRVDETLWTFRGVEIVSSDKEGKNILQVQTVFHCS